MKRRRVPLAVKSYTEIPFAVIFARSGLYSALWMVPQADPANCERMFGNALTFFPEYDTVPFIQIGRRKCFYGRFVEFGSDQMYAFIEGTIDSLEPECCVIDTGGVGYNVNISVRTMQHMPGIGESARLYTYTSVREDAIALYGFLAREDLAMFRMLLSVSGIGPKGALALLSEFTADEVRLAILTGDSKALSRAPGVGAKTAQRVILELKDKVKLPDERIAETLRGAAYGNAANGLTVRDESLSPAKQDALDALVALGYSHTESRTAVAGVEEAEGMDSGAILSAALKRML